MYNNQPSYPSQPAYQGQQPYQNQQQPAYQTQQPAYQTQAPPYQNQPVYHSQQAYPNQQAYQSQPIAHQSPTAHQSQPSYQPQHQHQPQLAPQAQPTYASQPAYPSQPAFPSQPSYPGQQPFQNQPVRAPAKLDQHAMPSAAQLINDEIDTYKNTDRQLKFTAPAVLPPLITTIESQILKMSLADAGCVRPCHMRSTIYQVPTTKELLDSSGLDFSIVVKPFDEGEVDGKFCVPLSASEISRCNRCKAYANPFSRNGRCCICNYTAQGMQELDQRPELHLGSYEFRVTPEYYREGIAESRRPHIIFAIEMTAHSRHLVGYLANNLAEIIKNNFPKDFLYSSALTPLVGFATYNSKITIYDVVNGGHAFVISDLTTVTDCASTSKFLADPAKDFEAIEKFLLSLGEMCNNQMDLEQQTVLGPVIEATLKTCYFDTSNNYNNDAAKRKGKNVIPTGKLYLFQSSLPTSGDDTTPGRLSIKRNIDEMRRHLGTEMEEKTLAVEGKYYPQLAQKCVTDYASGIELFLFPPNPRAYLNIATLGELTRLTGSGLIRKYHISSLENFKKDLQMSLKSTMAFDAQMRVRTSTGVSPVRYIGNFSNTSGSNLEMATLSTSSNFVVQMKYDDKIPENDLVVVQFAMIYTSVCGERRVRVHNLALSTCTVLADLYKSACCDTLVNVMVRDTVDKLKHASLAPKAAKEQMTSRVINILAAYRKHCTDYHAGSSSQLILPEGLKLLPVYLCGALKCDAIDGGPEMFPDDKALAQLNLLGALPSLSQATVYPRMFYIDACNASDEENELGYQAVLTRCYNLAIEEAKGQCYLLENGYYLFIYFPSTELGQSFLANVYGLRKDDQDINWDSRQKDTNETKFLEELISRCEAERRRALFVSVVRQGKDKLDNLFRTFLYEDKKRPDSVSYVDLLCYLHAEIRTKLSR